MINYNGIDPLEFWTKCLAMFPILAPVARRVLAMPATSASIEIIFTFDCAKLVASNF